MVLTLPASLMIGLWDCEERDLIAMRCTHEINSKRDVVML